MNDEYRSGLDLEEYPEPYYPQVEDPQPEEARMGPITMLVLALTFFVPSTAVVVYLIGTYLIA
jgi:hypothetical protein